MLREILARLRAEKPLLEKSFHLWLECYRSLAPGAVDAQALASLYKLTLAAEYAYAEPGRLLPLLLARGELAAFSDILKAAAKADYRLALAILDAYPGLSFPLSSIAEDLGALVAASSPGSRSRAHEVLSFCLSRGGEEECRFMLSRMAIIARRSPATVAQCAAAVKDRAGKTPPARLRDWIARGADLMDSDRVDEGVKLLLLESSEGRRMLGMSQAVLEDYRSVLRIYVASLSGRDFNVNGLPLSMYGFKAPYTDGATIFLPAEIHYFRDEEANRAAYSVAAAMQAASVSMGSFGLDGEALGFKDELRERYGARLPEILPNLRRDYEGLAESIRERKDGEIEALFPGKRSLLLLDTEHEKLFFSLPVPGLARELFRLAENLRIEAALSALYPGLRQDFSLVDAYLWKKRQRPTVGRGASERGDDGESRGFLAALETLIQHSLVRGAETADPKARACALKACGALDAVLAAGSTVGDSAAAMFHMYNALSDAYMIGPICKRLDLRQAFRLECRPEFRPEAVLATRPELLKAAAAPSFEPEEGEEKAKAIDFASLRESRKDGEGVRRAIGSGAVRLYRYQEYDYRRGGYLPNRCTVFETVLASSPNDYCERVLARHAKVYKRTKKGFLSMKPDDMEVSRHWYAGTEINVSDAVDYCLDLRRGATPDEKIYYRKLLNRRDLAVAVLLDASNSTELEVGSSTVIDIEKDSLAILASALDAIDDTFALFAFNSSGPGMVYVDLIKDFHEKWDAPTRQRIDALRPYGSNRDGCAIRHVAARLSRRPEKAKLLLMLSDGIPADIDYGEQTGMVAGEYAIEDTRRAIIEARELGIMPFCLNIDSRAKSYIGHLYGAYRYALLDDVSRLPERLTSLYMRLTG